ncbi:MAG: cytochrome c [Sinomicrobium sp.]|nr:cytochrome c [Sinomicrobium sp.]
MKPITNCLSVILLVLLTISCGQEKKEKKTFKYATTQSHEQKEVAPTTGNTADTPPVDLSNKGIGPVRSVTIAPEIDQELATEGATVFKTMCTACHKIGKKFIGPSLTGVLERRAPEWVMNMMLNPEEMTKNDPIAKQLLVEFNGAPMANQNLTQEQARAILEYLRTLK